MNITEILSGHTKELLNINDELCISRLNICKSCPLYLDKYGGFCNPDLWINNETGDTSDIPLMGWIKGCGCRLKAKTRNKDSHCVRKLW